MGKSNTVFKRGKHTVTVGDDGEPVPIGRSQPPQPSGPANYARGPPSLLTVEETAAILRVSRSSLNKWRVAGTGPVFVRVCGRIRYSAADVSAFIGSGRCASTSAPRTENHTEHTEQLV